ncbi:MAG: SIS domain-containing protein [Geminicoccaceae bacterium]
MVETEAANIAREVFAIEADTLRQLRSTTADQVGAAVNRLLAIRGRVVVTGMGKSGHIARKIAATLASTGTPASFVHPGEASHGDLGMIAEDDAVIALSNSGETTELGDLLAYSRRFGILLVAIVGKAPSTLADAADVQIVLPPLQEACPIRLAPTTSTTAMLAVGDAIASALLKLKGFGPSHFAMFHPGGKLGSRLARVRDLMHTGAALPLVQLDTPMAEAVVEMTEKRLGCVGVLDDGQLKGIITDGDLRRHLSEPRFLERRAREVMTESPRTITSDALAAEALARMGSDGERPVTALFVVDDREPVGLLHIHDCLRAGVA